MSWGTITGEEKILPSTGGGADEVKLESGKPVRVKLLLPDGHEPYSYLEHAVECEGMDAQGKMVRQFRTIRCPKTSDNPSAECPICDGQQFRRRVRNATNVWDYEQGKVQKLNAGEGVWKPIATTRKLGVNVLGVDWAILRTGTDRNDTEYSATNVGPAQKQDQIPADQLFNVEADYAPHTIDEMKIIIESIGLEWAKVIVPPALKYPTLKDALAHVMPNGKWKDKTFAEMWAADQSPRGMVNFLATKSNRITDEKAAAQVILVNLGGANIPGVPKYNSDGSVANMSGEKPAAAPAPAPIQTQPITTTPTPGPTPVHTQPAPDATVSNANDERMKKIDHINEVFSTNEKFQKGGFKLIMDTMKSAGNGKQNIAEFSNEEIDALLKLCEE